MRPVFGRPRRRCRRGLGWPAAVLPRPAQSSFPQMRRSAISFCGVDQILKPPPGSCRPSRRNRPAPCGKAGNGQRQKDRRARMRGNVRTQGRRAAQDLPVLRRLSCGCKELAHTAGAQARCRGEEAVVIPPSPPPSVPPACLGPVENGGTIAAANGPRSSVPPACLGPGRAGALPGKGRPSACPITRRLCRAAGFRNAREAHRLRGVQACRRPVRRHGRRPSPDGEFPGGTRRMGLCDRPRKGRRPAQKGPRDRAHGQGADSGRHRAPGRGDLL